MKESEIHVFIIWSKGLIKKDAITNDIAQKFQILQKIDTTWSKKNFSENLSRFYGENLPKNSSKEKHCGTNTFLCLLVKDKKPKYELRETSKGIKPVNINMFDAKKLYRSWTGGGHKVHGSDNIIESRSNMYMLYGYQYNTILTSKDFNVVKAYNKDLIGAEGWSSLDELFKAFNELSNYVVLRNFANIEDELNNLHPDIDVLTDNKNLIRDISNGKPTYQDKKRVQHLVMINNQNVFFDFRFVGDGYYDCMWEQQILKSKCFFNGFYIPNNREHFYSLMYHAFIHKPKLTEDYIIKLIELSKNEGYNYSIKSFLHNNVLEDLNNFLLIEKYNYVEPNDLTVYYNLKVIEKFGSFRYSNERRKNEKIREFKARVKRVFKRFGVKLGK